MDFAAATVLRNAGFERFDCVAGGETAGIPFAALLADRLELPMIYVRKKPKGYGRNAQIEGSLTKGARVLMVEDLTTAGGSMFHFINAVRDAGGVVEDGLALFLLRYLQTGGETVHRRWCCTPLYRDVEAGSRRGARRTVFGPSVSGCGCRFP